MATLVLRWPDGTSIISQPSACDHCRTPLAPRDLIPLLSYALNRRHCRSCSQPINPLHFRIEALCSGIGCAAMAVAPGLVGLAGLVFGCQLVALAALDWRHFWLPDRLNLILALNGIAAALAGLGPPVWDSLIGLVAGFLSLAAIAALYRTIRGRDGLGGGDPKLFGAIGAWLGWQPLPMVLALASISGLFAILIVRGGVSAVDRLPLGSLLAPAAFSMWLWRAWLA